MKKYLLAVLLSSSCFADGIATTPLVIPSIVNGTSTGTGAAVLSTSPALIGATTINANTAAVSPVSSSELLSLQQSDGSLGAYLGLKTYGTGIPAILSRASGGTAISKTAVPSGQIIFDIFAQAWDGSAFYQGGDAFFTTTENWTGSNHGTKFTVSGTATGGATRTVFMELSEGNAAITGRVSATKFIGSSSAPSIAVGAAAGTGSTATVVGNDSMMKITIVATAVTPTPSTALATVTLSSAYPNNMYVVCSGASLSAVSTTSARVVYYVSTSTSTFDIMAQASTPTAATYVYTCATGGN